MILIRAVDLNASTTRIATEIRLALDINALIHVLIRVHKMQNAMWSIIYPYVSAVKVLLEIHLQIANLLYMRMLPRDQNLVDPLAPVALIRLAGTLMIMPYVLV